MQSSRTRNDLTTMAGTCPQTRETIHSHLTGNAPAGRRHLVGPRDPRAVFRRPLTIFHVHGRMGRGGAEMRTLEIFRRLDRRQYRFHFCALSGRHGELDAEIRDLGGRVHHMPQNPIGFSRHFRRLLRRHRCDVVHSHLHYYSGYPLRLAAQCGVPVRVAHFRSTREDIVTTPARRLARLALSRLLHRYATNGMTRRWIDRYATDIVGVSRWALRCTWGPNWPTDSRCRVVYDGLEPAAFEGEPDRRGVRREFALPEEVPLVIHIGRMVEPKNHVRVVSIFGEIVRRRPEARLLLVGRTLGNRGDDAIYRRVCRRIAELGLEGRVVFGGERSDIPRLVKAADLLLFPSLWEGLGDVVLEARAAGTPVLADDLPSILEITDCLPGVRCLSLDQPDTRWADQAAKMLDNTPTLEMRRTALEFFRNSPFTVAQCAAVLGRVWQGGTVRRARGGGGING